MSFFDDPTNDQPRLRIETDPGTHGQPVTMTLTGDVDGFTAAQLHAAVTEALQHHHPARIDIHLAGVRFLDSGGIHGLIDCRAKAAQADCHIRLTHPRPLAYLVLDTLDLLETFGVTPSSPTHGEAARA